MKAVTLSGRNLHRVSFYVLSFLVLALLTINCAKNDGRSALQGTSGDRTGTGTADLDLVNFENYFWPFDDDWRWTFKTLDLSQGVQEYQDYKEIMSLMEYGEGMDKLDVFPLEASPIPWYGQPAHFQFIWYLAESDEWGELIQPRFAIKPAMYWELDPPWVWGGRHMSPGMTIQTDSTASLYDWGTEQYLYSEETMSLVVVFEGREDEPVVTPAGTFPDCIRMKHTIIRGGLPWYVEKLWFAWGHGMVKCHVTELPCPWCGFGPPLSQCKHGIKSNIMREANDIWYPQ
ncbi:MAG: hypothetical protein ACYS8W_10325 [Planctomycetota bacterium]|jgi:hypothetical protein